MALAILAAAATTLTSTALTAGLATAALAPAPAGAGPIDPANNFPSYYEDTNGLRLGICQAGPPNCLAGPEPIQDIHAAGGDAEAFYYAADASTRDFTVHLALEAAYAADGPDQEVVFQRTQLTARAGGLSPGTVYKVTDPYGTYNCTVESDGTISQNACRIETTPVAGEFDRALIGRLGPFLTYDGSAPAAPVGFIGDNATPHKVMGSPTGFNAFRVEGPGLTGSCTDPDGSTVDSCQQTDLFILQGKVVDSQTPSASVSSGTLDFGDPTTATSTKSLTYANTGTVPVTISSVALGGTNASAFSMENNCPATLAAGARCTIPVTFTPEPGKSSAATLTILDDTPASPRTIALKGSNLPHMTATPASLSFPNTGTGSTSPEDNVVIGNDGNGPLSVASAALVGASAAHYKLGPNNTCTNVAVPANGGCEIGVQFAPTTTGLKTANLRVTDANGVIVNVPLTGTGTTAPPAAPGAPSIGTATAGNATATVNWSAPTTGGTPTGYTVRGFTNGSTTASVTSPAAATATSAILTGLTNGTSYRFSVVATNATGSSPASALSNAVTPTAPDTVAPTVTAQSPAANATNVAVTSNVTATFSEAVQGVSGTTVTLRAVGGTADVPAAVTYNGTSRVATLDPAASLANGTQYTATLTGGPAAIRDNADNALATRSWSFTTAAADAAPTWVTRSPSPGATGVLRNANVTATFNEPVTGVVAGTGVTFRDPANAPVTGTTVAYDAATRTMTINPGGTGTTILAANTVYTVTLTANVQDAAGNPLAAADRTWSFTTGSGTTAATVAGAPTIGTPTAGNASATVRWTAPANNGGSAITGYSVRTWQGTSVLRTTPVGAVTSTTITGLTNGTAYTFDVAAVNAVGTGAFSARSTAVTPTAVATDPAPTVTSRNPIQGATGVSRTGNLTATFSENVTGVVAGTGVTLRNPSNVAVTGTTVSYNATTRTVTINPGGTTTNNLAANTRYTVTFTTAIQDSAGQSLPVADRTWTFTTGAA